MHNITVTGFAESLACGIDKEHLLVRIPLLKTLINVLFCDLRVAELIAQRQPPWPCIVLAPKELEFASRRAEPVEHRVDLVWLARGLTA